MDIFCRHVKDIFWLYIIDINKILVIYYHLLQIFNRYISSLWDFLNKTQITKKKQHQKKPIKTRYLTFTLGMFNFVRAGEKSSN